MKDEKGTVSSVKVSCKYIPVKMDLDPSESINNMGTLRIDVLDGTDLPSADRNGYSDPYCKFELNGEMIFKTQVQKKTLQPAWNEFFENEIQSRTAAELKCKVYDWDFAGDDDVLGDADVNLKELEPFRAQVMTLPLNGKSGSIRIRILFRPSYVTRSRQGSSTFSGTFAVPGKIVTGVAGAPIKGVGKGASFIRQGFKSIRTGSQKDSVATIATEEMPVVNGNGNGTEAVAAGASLTVAKTNASNGHAETLAPPVHGRKVSTSATSVHSALGGGGAPKGEATITLVAAENYPASSNVMLVVKQLPREKTVHKTKHVKASHGPIRFDETFTTACTADTQFQVQVRDHATFGSDSVLGQTLFFVDESGAAQEKLVTAGSGHVVIKSTFVGKEGSEPASPPRPVSTRMGFLGGKKENGRAVSREGTPA